MNSKGFISSTTPGSSGGESDPPLRCSPFSDVALNLGLGALASGGISLDIEIMKWFDLSVNAKQVPSINPIPKSIGKYYFDYLNAESDYPIKIKYLDGQINTENPNNIYTVDDFENQNNILYEDYIRDE